MFLLVFFSNGVFEQMIWLRFGPLLKKYGLSFFSLSSGGHHHELNATKIKELIQTLKQHSQVLWIFEDQVSFKDQLKKYVRKNDLVLNINTFSPSLPDANALFYKIKGVN